MGVARSVLICVFFLFLGWTDSSVCCNLCFAQRDETDFLKACEGCLFLKTAQASPANFSRLTSAANFSCQLFESTSPAFFPCQLLEHYFVPCLCTAAKRSRGCAAQMHRAANFCLERGEPSAEIVRIEPSAEIARVEALLPRPCADCLAGCSRNGRWKLSCGLARLLSQSRCCWFDPRFVRGSSDCKSHKFYVLKLYARSLLAASAAKSQRLLR